MRILTERLSADDITLSLPYLHETIDIGLILAGSVKIKTCGIHQVLSVGDIYSFSPNQPYTYTEKSDELEILQIRFYTELIHTHQDHYFYKNFLEPMNQGLLQIPPFFPVNHPVAQQIKTQVLLISQTSDLIQHFSAAMEICLLLLQHKTTPTKNKTGIVIDNKITLTTVIYIMNNYQKPLRLETIAQHANCHPNYLCNVFKAYTGQTIFEHLTQVRLDVAMDILRKDNLPIGKIIEMTGFSSRNYFYKKFRQVTGISPTTYRKKYSIWKPASSENHEE